MESITILSSGRPEQIKREKIATEQYRALKVKRERDYKKYDITQNLSSMAVFKQPPETRFCRLHFLVVNLRLENTPQRAYPVPRVV